MRPYRITLTSVALPALALTAALFSTGCPPVDGPGDSQAEYDRGFFDGFEQDDYYWNGFFDGWDTLGPGPLFYSGDEIPFVETPYYDAGYYDGLWYAYHDGYYTDYRYGFVVGFSEGYDNAYWPDYLEFLAADQHVEYLHGGFDDGYHDGYSEGRIFGAYDFESGLPFDWLDALLDYESGTDLFFAEIPVGTREDGPVVFFEYGTDPNTLVKAVRKTPKSFEKARSKDVNPDELPLFRPIIQEAANVLDVAPLMSMRSDVELALNTTWLERIEDYRAESGQKGRTSTVVRSRTNDAGAPPAGTTQPPAAEAAP
jgi:hypothetical protein